MSIITFEIYRFVEIAFLIGIVVNLISYLVRFFIIFRNRQMKIFFQTLREGISRRVFIRNGLNLSLLVTSISVFWYMLKISTNLKPLSIQLAYSVNSLLTVYILISSLGLVVYSFVISILNIKKVKELKPVLGYLYFWNSADNLIHLIGGGYLFKPVAVASSTMRKYLIRAKLSEILVGAIVLVILEYLYKILIVLALLYLIKGKIL